MTISLFSFLFYSFLLCDQITPPDHSKTGSVLSEPALFLSEIFEHPFFDRDLARPLNHAGGSPCPGISFLHRLVGHASCVSNTPCPGGKIFAEPQRRAALCGARETAASAAGTKRKGHLRFPFLFELLPFPYLLARRKSESGDRSENGYGSRVTAAFVSQPIRSSRITHCYTYGLLSAGAANRAAQLVCLMATDGTCEFFCANTLYLIFSPLFTLFLQLHTKKNPKPRLRVLCVSALTS